MSSSSKSSKPTPVEEPSTQIRLVTPKADNLWHLVDNLGQETEKAANKNFKVIRDLLQDMWVDDSNKFHFSSANQKTFGPYDLVILCMDHNPRSSRRAGFKSLMEQNLHVTGRVAACVGRSIMCTAMAVLVEFRDRFDITSALDKKRLPYESIVYKSSVLQTAVRRPDQSEWSWMLVSTPAWSKKQRGSHAGGRWDKDGVGDELVRAFAESLGVSHSRKSYRFITPTFHWTGASALNEMGGSPPKIIFDGDANFGYCGDVCGGHGPIGALGSGLDMAGCVKQWLSGALSGQGGKNLTVLPLKATDWDPRGVRNGDDDSFAFHSEYPYETGRLEARDGLDHTWEVAACMNHLLLKYEELPGVGDLEELCAEVAQICKVNMYGKKLDSLAKYRFRPGARSQLENDRKRDLARASEVQSNADAVPMTVEEEGPEQCSTKPGRKKRWGNGRDAGSAVAPAEAPQASPSEQTAPTAKSFYKLSDGVVLKPAVRVEEIDPHNMYVVRNFLRTEGEKADLLESVFPVGTRGICGGIVKGERVHCPPKAWMPTAWGDVASESFGLHGQHLLEKSANPALFQNLSAVLDTVPPEISNILRGFSLDTVQVSFENVDPQKGPLNKTNNTLCGWSKDKCRSNSQPDPKLILTILDKNLQSIQKSFKYSKQDQESLDVVLHSGDLLVICNDGRNWVSAMTGLNHSKNMQSSQKVSGNNIPFSYSFVKLLDHRELRKRQEHVHEEMHGPIRIPADTDFGYKWHQCGYEVYAEKDGGQRMRVVEKF